MTLKSRVTFHVAIIARSNEIPYLIISELRLGDIFLSRHLLKTIEAILTLMTSMTNKLLCLSLSHGFLAFFHDFTYLHMYFDVIVIETLYNIG